MRLSAFACVAVLCSAGGLAAQQPRYASYGGPACAAPACDCPPRCDYSRPPSVPPSAPPAAPQQAPNGYYAAPPQNGVMEGASSSVEVEGATLRFPALDIKLPCLRLPSFSKIHKNPQMHIAEARAPYVQQPTVAYGAPIAVQPVAAPPAPQQSPPQQSPPQQSPPYNPNCQPPHCDAPRGYPPHCDAAALMELQQQLRQRDQRIEQLDQQIGRMASTMERLTEVVERISPATAAVAPHPDHLVIREPQRLPPPPALAEYQARLRLQTPPTLSAQPWPVAPAAFAR